MTPRANFTLHLPGNRTLQLGARTLVMGILNVTPDSFADGGLYLDPGAAEAAAVEMEARGADFDRRRRRIHAPRRGHDSADEEIARIQPVLKRLVAVDLAFPFRSIHRRLSALARSRALGLRGASARSNDVTGLEI